jgi:hypothetical protein
MKPHFRWFILMIVCALSVGADESLIPGAPGRPVTASASLTARERLAKSLADIKAACENIRAPGLIRRRHLWLVGEALPWRSSLQPSCRRLHDYQLEKTPQVWPAATDAPSLRVLLADDEPGIRALAAEALATLHEPEDVPRLAALLTDSAEAGMELVAPAVGQLVVPDLTGPGPDAVIRHTWHNSNVSQHAAWGLYLMLGDCCPGTIRDQHFSRFGAVRSYVSPETSRVDFSTLARLSTGDPQDHLWYWQEHIHRAMHQLEAATPSAEERRRAERTWIHSFFADTQSWPPERRAMVRLQVSDIHQGGADMAYYDTPQHLLFAGPLELGLEKKRVLELLDGVELWPDERTDRGGRSQVVERLAMGWRECFEPTDVPRLKVRFANTNDDLWWGARAALVVAMANLMPTSGAASDDPNSAEGFLRHTFKEDHDVFVRNRAAAELQRLGSDIHWPFIMDRCFADRDNGDYLLWKTLTRLAKAPAGDEPTRQLIQLVTDDRYRPLWLESERSMGKGSQGGRSRRRAADALNSRLGREVVTKDDLTTLQDPEQGPMRLQQILARLPQAGK